MDGNRKRTTRQTHRQTDRQADLVCLSNGRRTELEAKYGYGYPEVMMLLFSSLSCIFASLLFFGGGGFLLYKRKCLVACYLPWVSFLAEGSKLDGTVCI
jgi:hypothetical protein